jgi:hypothetical protein
VNRAMWPTAPGMLARITATLRRSSIRHASGSPPGGRLYILVSSDSDLNLFSALIARARFQARLVAERSIFIESLIIYELRAR